MTRIRLGVERKKMAPEGAKKEIPMKHESTKRPLAQRPIDIQDVARRALVSSEAVIQRLCPGGVRRGREYLVCNPNRADRRPGSFSINLRTGKWGDFACGVSGGDLVSLAAYLDGISQLEAARRLARMLGLESEARYG